MTLPTEFRCRFSFEQDTFAFANELFWEYRFDSATGTTTTASNEPPPTYAHRCFVLVRSARQFFYHARFEPMRARAEADVYRRLIREIVSRSPRRKSVNEDRVAIPGYNCLRSFSQDQEALLKAECGSAWESYFVRSHWRMVFPVWRRHQERIAARLATSIHTGAVPIVHLFRFPRITINHGIVLFDSVESEREFQFKAYDPNIPSRPVNLIFDRVKRAFFFPRKHYWEGGRVSVIEAYRGGLY